MKEKLKYIDPKYFGKLRKESQSPMKSAQYRLGALLLIGTYSTITGNISKELTENYITEISPEIAYLTTVIGTSVIGLRRYYSECHKKETDLEELEKLLRDPNEESSYDYKI